MELKVSLENSVGVGGERHRGGLVSHEKGNRIGQPETGLS